MKAVAAGLVAPVFRSTACWSIAAWSRAGTIQRDPPGVAITWLSATNPSCAAPVEVN